jgi:hypothetical protein
MAATPGTSLVVPSQFIQAIRDSGYKSLGSAVAELIDNAFEAKATRVALVLEKAVSDPMTQAQLTLCDNGRGMDAQTVSHALQFGWSSRFNQRDSFGRYGMGLPNASLSHARRVEVWSSPDGRAVHAAHLDVDEVVAGKQQTISPPRRVDPPTFKKASSFSRGTVVLWKKCDRLKDRRHDILLRKLRAELGCLFRYQLWEGKKITVNGQPVQPFDPLFQRQGTNMTGAKPFGPELLYPVVLPGTPGRTSTVAVRFSELPVAEWHSLSNEQKNAQGIAKRAGVSIVRARREIDRGWFFMGQKRRENYDDWWRCELLFAPELDELFGVTHTKQEIRPTEQIIAILTPDMEKIARELNTRARQAFVAVKEQEPRRDSEKIAERLDNLIEPPAEATKAQHNGKPPRRRGGRGRVAGLQYRLKCLESQAAWLFSPELDGAQLTVLLNERHPFFKQGHWAHGRTGQPHNADQNALELLLLAAARAEVTVGKDKLSKHLIQHFRETWSNILTTFLS